MNLEIQLLFINHIVLLILISQSTVRYPSSANIYPKPKDNKLKNKILVKIGERLIKKFHLNGGKCFLN